MAILGRRKKNVMNEAGHVLADTRDRARDRAMEARDSLMETASAVPGRARELAGDLPVVGPRFKKSHRRRNLLLGAGLVFGGVALAGGWRMLRRKFASEPEPWTKDWPSSGTAAGGSWTPAERPAFPQSPTNLDRPATDTMTAEGTKASEQHRQEFGMLIGRPVVDPHGSEIGTVQSVYYRPQRGTPEWVALETGIVDPKRVLVPLEGATVGERVETAYPKEQVADAPVIEGTVLGEDEEMRLYQYYNVARYVPGSQTERERESVALIEWTPEPGGSDESHGLRHES
jgi:hypothetical protein